MMAENVILGENVKKSYDGFFALRGVDFCVRSGEIVGFLGPNGAGKTTLIKLITCTSFFDEGTVSVYNLDTKIHPKTIKSYIGLVPQDNNLDPDFTVYENLVVYSRYFFLPKETAKKRIDELLKFVSLLDRKNSNVNDLSGGMKRRLIIARSLINDPKLIILDEPTTGLDPQARRHIWELIRELKRNGKTIVLTTHYMEEAEELCDRVYILDSGQIVVNGSPSELISKYIGKETVEIENCDEIDLKALSGKKVVYKDKIYIHSQDKKEVLEKLVALCVDVKFVVRPSNLEDLFIFLTGKELRE